MSFFGQLLVGPSDPQDRLPRQGWSRSKELLQEEWRRDSYGLYRLVRLMLVLAPWLFPTIYIDQILRSDKPGRVAISRELYYSLRLIFILAALHMEWWHSSLVACVVAYFCIDLMSHLAGGAIVWGKYSIHPQRTLLWSFVNYGELTLAFSVFYLHYNCLNWKSPSVTQAIYFSLVTSTTLGLGDLRPADVVGQELVIAQLATFVVFLLLLLSTFLSRVVPEARRS